MSGTASSDLRDSYLDLLKRSVLGTTVGPVSLYRPLDHAAGPIRDRVMRRWHRRGRSVLAVPVVFDLAGNEDGTIAAPSLPPWPMTMIGRRRLDNVEACIRSVIEGGVPGDLIETGVWRGGTTIFMRGMLRAYGVADRTVYVADSFAGLPAPDPQNYPADEGITLHLWPELTATVDEVRANFERFGLLDDRVVFVKGWFRDTLPGLRGHPWAVIRLDGDLYESTMNALDNLYDDLSPGGWVIVDDYEIPACRQAVTDYRERCGITEPIVEIDWTGVCWQKRG